MRTSPAIPAALVLLTTLIMLSPIAGGPVGTAHAAAVSSSDDPHPSPFVWTNGQVALRLNGASPTFWVSSPKGGLANVSVSVVALAEVAPDGALRAFTPLGASEIVWNLSWANASSGVVVTLQGQVPASTLSGAWNTTELPEEGSGNLGLIQVTITFHLFPAPSSGGWDVKFDVAEAGWPWLSPADQLGVQLSMLPTGGSGLNNPPSGDDIDEVPSGSGAPVANLTWGPTATVTYANGSNATASVVGGATTASDGSSSVVRLLFGSVAAGYTSLFYDPKVSLNPSSLLPPGLPAWAISATAWLVIGVAVASVLVLAASAARARTTPPREALAPASTPAAGSGWTRLKLTCRRCGTALQVSPVDSVRLLVCPSCHKI